MATFTISDRTNRRLIARLNRLKPDSPQMERALFAIGTLLTANAKRRATAELAVDTGLYRARIAAKYDKAEGLTRVSVGAFGIKYARMIEYGGVMTRRQMRAMFASMRERGRPRRPGKGIIINGHYTERPIMRRALEETRPRVTEIILQYTRL